jgi:predicted nucleic acid-binding protein
MTRGSTRGRDEGVSAVPVNADLEIEDRILGPFTARQTAILATAAVVLWLVYAGLHRLVPPIVILAAALIVGGALVAAITTKKDGLSLDRYALAALRHHRRGNRYVSLDADEEASPGFDRLDLPPAGLDEAGVLDLGADGAAVLIECGTVNLTLRSGDEVHTALAGLGQAVNALGGAFQFAVTAHRVDLSSRADHVEAGAARLAHPALEDRARAHAGLLREISGERDLITRRVLLILREDGPATQATGSVLHRAGQAAALLTGCGITARILNAPEATAALAAATDTSRPQPATAQAPPGRAVRAMPDAPWTTRDEPETAACDSPADPDPEV